MPTLTPFKLERYFARHEFRVRHLLSCSDCESLTLRELLALADADSLSRWESLALGYTESAGLPALREEVAGMYATLAPDDLLILAPEEGIFIAMSTLLEEGDDVIAVAPAYQSLHEVARARGCTITSWPLIPEGTRWRLDIDRLAGSFTPATRLLVINFPHNPTGHTLATAELGALLALAREHDVYVFSDEMYRLLERDPADRLPAVCDIYDKGVSLSGLSKSFALPGLRVGWLATRAPALMERWVTFKDYTTICSSAPSEVLALAALRAREPILARSLAIIAANLEHAARFFAAHPALFTWRPPIAGPVAFPQWLGPGTAEAFCQSLLDEAQVMLVPGSLFDYPGGHFRVGLGRRNFASALAHVEEHLSRRHPHP